MKIEIKPATREMIEQVSGHTLKRNAKALALLEGDTLLGVAGLYLDPESTVLFANMVDPMKDHKRMVIKAYRILLNWCRNRGLPVLATACPTIEGSQTLLEHLGFRVFRAPNLYIWNGHG